MTALRLRSRARTAVTGRAMKWLAKRIAPVLHGQRGISLIEVLVAVAILGVIGVVFIAAMGTAYDSVGMVDKKTQAEAMIRSQLDQIKAVVYEDSGVYPVTISIPNQYSVTISAEALDDRETGTCADADNCNTLQKVTVSVFRSGEGGDVAVLSVHSYKVKE